METLAQEIIDNNTYTPKSIAWKLLMDDDIAVLSAKLFEINPDDLNDTDPNSYLFEILITIFMEMIFNSAILISATNDDDIESFNPDLSKFNINNFLPLIKEKFKKINILAVVNEFENNEHTSNKILSGRYCRIILKCDIKSHHFFKKNNIDENYHMILNTDFKKSNKLNNIYATVIINNVINQIYFDKIF